MKPRLRDYLTILLALVVIFLCGSGVGYLLGEKQGRSQTRNQTPPPAPEDADWAEAIMKRLDRSLDLTGEQRLKIREEVEKTSQKVKASRNQALQEYKRHLLELHDQLLPHLNPEQREKIESDRKSKTTP